MLGAGALMLNAWDWTVTIVDHSSYLEGFKSKTAGILNPSSYLQAFKSKN